MSDGLARVAGGGVYVKFDGQDVIIPAMTLRDYAAVEHHILSQRQNPMEKVREMLPGLAVEVQKHLLDLAYNDMKHGTTVSQEDVNAFVNTVDGVVFTLWLLLNRAMPNHWSMDRIREIVEGMTWEELQSLMNARDQAAGTDELGN